LSVVFCAYVLNANAIELIRNAVLNVFTLRM
jgi:hypothetical protein